jgi:hypothetical protein
MASFGSFAPLCSSVPSYPWCNLFSYQLAQKSPGDLNSASTGPDAPVGVNIECGIPRAVNGNLGNLGNMLACGVSIFVIVNLIVAANRRKAAVARIELRGFLVLYLLSLPFQLLTTGSVLAHDSLPLVVLSAIHAGIVAALFWMLLMNAVVATQIVEDGTLASLIPFYAIAFAFFAATTYISLDVALTISGAFGPSNPPLDLKSIPLFVLTSIWPPFAAVVWFLMMCYVVVVILREQRPLWFVAGAAILFAVAQVIYFLVNKLICHASSAKVDGSLIATVLETASVVMIYLAWRSITEDNWDDMWHGH